jgi:hypothetical protein
MEWYYCIPLVYLVIIYIYDQHLTAASKQRADKEALEYESDKKFRIRRVPSTTDVQR